MDFSSDFKHELYNTVHHDKNVGPSLKIEDRYMSDKEMDVLLIID
jgi:hypothetical protein